MMILKVMVMMVDGCHDEYRTDAEAQNVNQGHCVIVKVLQWSDDNDFQGDGGTAPCSDEGTEGRLYQVAGVGDCLKVLST